MVHSTPDSSNSINKIIALQRNPVAHVSANFWKLILIPKAPHVSHSSQCAKILLLQYNNHIKLGSTSLLSKTIIYYDILTSLIRASMNAWIRIKASLISALQFLTFANTNTNTNIYNAFHKCCQIKIRRWDLVHSYSWSE